MSKVLSLRVEDDLADWVDSYAESRGVSRQVLLEGALASFKEDCEGGVPELRAKIRKVQAQSEPRDGECLCPTFLLPNGKPKRGFKQACPVHGQKTREDFARACKERAELFEGLRAPASVKKWGAGS